MEKGEGGKESVIEFSEGQLVEVRSINQWSVDTWFNAKIIKLPNRKTKKSILVEFVDSKPSKSPRSVYVNESLIRPLPLEEPPNQFLVDQLVDVLHGSAWRKGKISEVHGDSRYTIWFPYAKTEKYMDFGHKDLRLHQDWIGGKWVQPYDQDIDTKLDQDDVRKKNLAKEGNFWDSSKTSVQCLRKNLAGKSPPLISRSGSFLNNQCEFQPNTEITSREVSRNHQEVPNTSNVTKGSMRLEDYTNMGDEFHNAIEDGPKEIVTQTLLSDHISDIVTVENDNLPFVKSNFCAWETVESMEVFRSIPQYPHFRPLQQKNEFVREGKAVSYMISFATIAEETRRSQLEDPKSSLESKLNALPKLETMGFNVDPIRAQLCKMLSAKDKHLELDVMSKQIEEKMLLEKHDADLLQFEMDENGKKIQDLEESISQMESKRRRLMMENQTKDYNTLALQERIYEVKRKIEKKRFSFNHVAAVPW